MSPLLFNVYAEEIMREALTDWSGGIRVGEWKISYLRYADDISLLANTEEELTELIKRVQIKSKDAGQQLNVGKTKILTTGTIGRIEINGENVEVVASFPFLWALIHNNGLCEKEIRRRIAKRLWDGGRTY